ncbi:glycosyltransferase family 2 protein [Flavobacterium circumlabens]|uniref:Glycosyltransferase family 2 protein n=1 Tax=Flavobacterium circumlabens TaxID=2133765 RepID=A0A4Y7UCB1_9FLAO|nr:glycosyltransferase family 2 protein [Flavobacterium circumlabens]TCN56388.1 glycosyltransferase involved in cell wall biosynthesis [Flavobacterium circumlabens]TEB43422.1 glycosyltransferase family 2 protein [Flavobacterium circumlabens]
MNPLVSVIVPNFNHANFLERRLESIFNQSYSNIEVILLDDCSVDNSREILSEYAKNPKVSHCVFNEINSGNTFIQWHKGIQLAKGDFIWIAESDDSCKHNLIEELIKPLIEDEKIVLSYAQSNKINELDEITGSWLDYTLNLDNSAFDRKFVMEGTVFVEKFLIHKNVIPNASAVIFRYQKNISEYITVDKELRYCGDWIFYFKLLLNNKVAFTPEKLNNFRYHCQSVIAKALKADDKMRLLNLDIVMRSNMKEFLQLNKSSNYWNIIAVNAKIVKEIKYNKALLFFENKEYGNWFKYLIMIPKTFIMKNKYVRRLKKRLFLYLNLKNKE